MKTNFWKGALVLALSLGLMGATSLLRADEGVEAGKGAVKKADKAAAKEAKKAEKAGKCCPMKGPKAGKGCPMMGKDCKCPSCGAKCEMKCACDKCGAVCDKPGKCGKCDKGVCKMSCKCPKCGKEMKMGEGMKCPMGAEKGKKKDRENK